METEHTARPAASSSPAGRGATALPEPAAAPTTLLGIDRQISAPLDEVVVGGRAIGAREIVAVARGGAAVRFTDDPAVLDRIAASHARMMEDIAGGVPVYGCNTGYGAQAARVVVPGSRRDRVGAARSISEGIAAIDVSVGPPFAPDVVRAGVLLRVNMLMGGVSGVKLADRHLARLVDPARTNGLPANLSDPAAVTGCAFKGVQIQAGMLDVYSTLLSFPVTTLFGVHEEGNQDVTSHALTSGILALENLKLARYALAQQLLALAQAVDCRGGPADLSPRTRPLYEFIRARAEPVTRERPLHAEVERLYEAQVSGELADLLRTRTFADLGG